MVEVYSELRGKISSHGVYKQFAKRSSFSYTRVQSDKVVANSERVKKARIEYLVRYLPHHHEERFGERTIVYIDECGFTLDEQGALYGWSKRGTRCVQEVPIKSKRISVIAAISRYGLIAYQLVQGFATQTQFLMFMSELVEKLVFKNSIQRSTSNLSRISMQENNYLE